MSSATPHRIDPPIAVKTLVGGPHVGTALPLSAKPQRVHAPAVATGTATDPADASSETREPLSELEDWLQLHASDLIDRLQAWADDLDAREAKLNARTSLQDLRERRFRLEQQNAETELDEQRQSTQRLRRQVEADARRLAFRNDSVDI